MAVQVPMLNRNPVQESTSVGRIDVNAPDVDKQQEVQTQGIEKDGDYLAKVAQLAHQGAIDTEVQKRTNAYQNYVNDAIDGPNGLKYWKGDPTEAHDKFLEDIKSKGDELLGDENLSDDTKAQLAGSLDKVKNRTYDRANTVYGQVYNAYQTNIADDGVKLGQKDLVSATEVVNPKDDHSYAQFDNAISNIQDIRIKSALQNGSAKLGPDGAEILNPSVKIQLAKDLSDGVYQAIDNLNTVGKTDEAAAMMEKYGSYLDPINRKKLMDGNEKEVVTNKALEQFSMVRQLPDDVAFAKLDKITDPKIREKALSELDTYQRQKQNNQTRAQKDTYNSLAQNIATRMNGPNPFVSSSQMFDDPMIKSYGPDKNISPKQRDALVAMVEAPKTSDIKTKSKVYDLMTTDAFAKMDYATLNQSMSGLNKHDRGEVETKWNNLRTQTQGQEASMTKYMLSQVDDQLQAVGYVKKVRGFYSNDDEKRVTDARGQMLEAMKSFPPGYSTKEQYDYVKKFATSVKAGEVFKPANVRNTPPPVPPKTATISTTPGVPTDSMDMNTKIMWAKRYKAEKGVNPDATTDDLSNYIKAQTAKGN